MVENIPLGISLGSRNYFEDTRDHDASACTPAFVSFVALQTPSAVAVLTYAPNLYDETTFT